MPTKAKPKAKAKPTKRKAGAKAPAKRAPKKKASAPAQRYTVNAGDATAREKTHHRTFDTYAEASAYFTSLVTKGGLRPYLVIHDRKEGTK